MANGRIAMPSNEKFERFKHRLINENEKTYGKEVRSKFGDDEVDASNAKLMGMTEEQYAEVERLSAAINGTLKNAVANGDPSCELAQKACDLHRQWLCKFWRDGAYSKEAHRGLGEMYVADERFVKYYDAIAPGCAEFLRDALDVYCGSK